MMNKQKGRTEALLSTSAILPLPQQTLARKAACREELTQ